MLTGTGKLIAQGKNSLPIYQREVAVGKDGVICVFLGRWLALPSDLGVSVGVLAFVP